jgi:hypothetical protein
MELLENKLVRFGLVLAAVLFIVKMLSDRSVENLEEVEDDVEVDVDTEEELMVETEPASMIDLAKTDSEPAAAPMGTGDELEASDLLPQDDESADFAQRHPEGLGPLAEKNFLTAGYHVGINTVGTSLRNANTGFRSEPANPSGVQSPWNQTTITPDINRRGFEIGDC